MKRLHFKKVDGVRLRVPSIPKYVAGAQGVTTGVAGVVSAVGSFPLSNARTTVSSSRPLVSKPSRNCLAGLSSSRSSIHSAQVAAWIASSGSTPCLRPER